jgi:hypothetical protein
MEITEEQYERIKDALTAIIFALSAGKAHEAPEPALCLPI